MEESKLDIPILQPGEKIIGHAYVTDEGEIVFTPHSGTREVVLVEARAGSSGPWAVRLQPALRAGAGAARA